MTATEIRAAVDAILAREGISYAAQFVPFEQSRNAAAKHRSLNWKVTLFRKAEKAADRNTMTTDYMQGIGHIPAIIGKSYPMEMRAREFEASNSGRYQVRANASYQTKPLPIPSAADVLSCLILDAGALDAGCFELWADEYGYEKDSRAAEVTYRACVDSGLALRRLLGAGVMNELREATADL